MVLWFVATAVLTIHFVFRDPRFDHRPLILGALLPDVLDAPFGGARWFHSLTVAVAVLAAVMVLTVGRRRVRTMLLGIPIGILLHLVFDAAFDDTDVFWWPFSGGFGGARLPLVERGWWNLVLEAVGLLLCLWAFRRFGLADPARRRAFARSGTLAETGARRS